MSAQPKVSNRMRHLVMNLEADSRRYSLAKLQESETALLSAIAELEQKAAKWKEAAVAIHEAAMCARGIVLTKRVEAAFAALGGEWDEAVTANRQEAKP